MTTKQMAVRSAVKALFKDSNDVEREWAIEQLQEMQNKSDLTVVADKVICFLEKAPGATYKQILGQFWQSITRDDLQIILMTLRDGGIIDERSIGGNLIYSVLPVRKGA